MAHLSCLACPLLGPGARDAGGDVATLRVLGLRCRMLLLLRDLEEGIRV